MGNCLIYYLGSPIPVINLLLFFTLLHNLDLAVEADISIQSQKNVYRINGK